MSDSAGDQTQNLWFRRPAPYPLGHGVLDTTVVMETNIIMRPWHQARESNPERLCNGDSRRWEGFCGKRGGNRSSRRLGVPVLFVAAGIMHVARPSAPTGIRLGFPAQRAGLQFCLKVLSSCSSESNRTPIT